MTSAAAVLCGCQFIGGFAGNEIVDPGQGGQGGSPTGGGDVGGSAGGQGGGTDECALSQAPGAPDEAVPGDEVSFILAAKTVELGEGLDRPIGLDIDDACTCNDAACPCASVATCTRPSLVDTDDDWQRCDEPAGVDSNSRHLFNIVQTFDPLLSSQFISFGISAGGGSLLLDVREYNGLPDDDKVFVGVYTTGAFQSAECNSSLPQWDGEDAWPIDAASVFNELPTCGGTPFPTVFDPSAYVVDGTLVARLDEVTLAIQFGGEALKLTVRDVTAVVPLQQRTDDRWYAAGATLAGRWRIEDVFRGLGELDKVSPVDLCDPNMLGSTQSNVCAFVDTATHARPREACNAVSFAAEFDAEEARVGNTLDLPSSNACPALLALDCETPVQ